MKITTVHLTRLATVALAITALVLAIMLGEATADDETKVLPADQKRSLTEAPYANPITVNLPTSQVTVAVAEPVRSLGAPLVELDDDERTGSYWELDRWEAPEGGSLVPVTWSIRELGGFTRQPDKESTTVRLVAGGKSIPLASVKITMSSDELDLLDPTSMVYSFDDELDLDDITIEVEFDGLTQVVHPATGDIDTGVAQPLYAPDRNYAAGCLDVDDECDLHGQSADGSVRAEHFGFTSSHVTLYPYDHKLGWAEEGHLWAGVRLQFFDGTARTATGDWIDASAANRPQVTLDGQSPVRLERLTKSSLLFTGRAVFDVPEDAEPQTLTLRQAYDLEGGRGTLPVRARVALAELPG